jgi:hypothetical protein
MGPMVPFLDRAENAGALRYLAHGRSDAEGFFGPPPADLDRRHLGTHPTVVDRLWEELNQALAQEARRVPGYERQVIDYYRKNPDAVNHLRAPIFEEKVVDFIVELAKPNERKVTPQELMKSAEPDSEPGSEPGNENAPAA